MPESLEVGPNHSIITYNESDRVKTGALEVVTSSGEKESLIFASRFQGKKQLLERVLPAANYDDLYALVTDADLPELTPEEIEDLTANAPEGYTLDDYHSLSPEGGLRTVNNPVGVEYTLTFGLDKGKLLTHGDGGMLFFQTKLAALQKDGKGDSPEAGVLKAEMRKISLMKEDYSRLSVYANPRRFEGDVDGQRQRRIVAEIRAFRVLHPWVYKDIAEAHKRATQPKKKFVVHV